MAVGGSSGGGAGAIRAGRAFVELFAEDSKLQRTLASWKSRLNSFAGFVSKIGIGMIGGGAAILAPLLGIFASTLDHLDALDEAATRLGTTPEVFDALAKSAKMAGVESEALESSVSKMQVALSDAASGGKEASEAFASLGLNAKELMQLPLDEQLARIADGLEKIENAADKTAAARKIFGKGGASMLPLLANGGDGLRSGLGDFRDPGLNEAAKNAGRLNDALDKMKFAAKSAVGSLVFGFIDLVGPVETVANGITRAAISARGFIRENSAVVVGVAAGAAALVAGGVAFLAFGGILSLTATAVGGFAAAFLAMKAVVLAAVSPLGLVVLAVVALGAGLAYLWSTTEDGKGAIAQLKAGAGELAETFAGAFQGIKDAFAAGDLALAGQIAFTALKLEFTKMLAFWTDRWNGFKGYFVDGWHDAVKLLKLALTDGVAFMEGLFLDLGAFIRKNVGNSFTNVLKEILQKYISVMDFLNIGGVNTVQLIAAKKLMEGLDLSAEDVGAKKAAGEQDRLRRRKQIEDEAAAAQEARKKAREEDKQALDDKIKRLQGELTKLEIDASLDASLKRIQDELNGPAGGAAIARRMSAFSAGGKGGFGGPLAAQFGVGDTIEKQQLETLNKIEDGVKDLPKDIGREFGRAIVVG